VDAADTFREQKREVVDQILEDLGVTKTPLYVFNKIDLLTTEQLAELQEAYKDWPALYVSAKTGAQLQELKEEIVRIISTKILLTKPAPIEASSVE
jgi:50S ribosomal subunit-associated GTPase HflX